MISKRKAGVHFGELTILAAMMLGLPLASCDDDKTTDTELCQKACDQSKRCETETFSSDYESVNQCVDDCMTDEVMLGECLDDKLTQECRALAAKLERCIVSLNCDDYYDYWEELTEDYPCKNEDANFIGQCEQEYYEAEEACYDSLPQENMSSKAIRRIIRGSD